MSSAQNRFNCICGGSYATEAELKQHQRRYCKGGPSTNNEGTCPICGSSFNSYRGMRQHMRQQHLAEYNADMEAESRNARAASTEHEENALAKAEANFEDNDIYAHLMSISTRSKDALKGRRKMKTYREKVRRHREEIQQNQERQEQYQPATDSDLTEGLRTVLRDYIADIPSEGPDELANNFRSRVIDSHDTINRQSLDIWGKHLINRYRGRPQRRTNRNRPPSVRENIARKLQHPNLKRKQRRRLEFKLAQYEFNNDQKALADRILDDRNIIGSEVRPSAADFIALCRSIFTTQSKEDREPIQVVHQETQIICNPITPEEIIATIESNKSDAAGADGLTIKDDKKIPVQQLSLLYNNMLLTSHTPSCLKRSRTIFIPKKDNNLEDINNWRPITIPSILSRIMNKILMNRLNNIQLNSCQRGFTKIDGCFANYATVETIIKTRRKKGQPLCLVFLDPSKSFDTVSHESIERALRRLNIDLTTQQFIKESYSGCITSASCNTQHIGDFEVNREVKQGDPHSPFLFNAVIDELLESLQSRGGVPVGNNSKISALAYADDIELAMTNVGDAQRMIEEAIAFFDKRGLTVNARKCASMVIKTVPSKKKAYIATKPSLKIGEEDIPTINIGEAFSYLGQKFSTDGPTPCNAEKLQEQLTSIKKAALKPHQKLCILTKYLIPPYIASLQRPNVNKKILKNVDKKIRQAVRQMLSLFQHSNNNIMYGPVKTGGLGIYNFTSNIPITILSRWEKIRQESSLIEDTYQLSIAWVNRLKRIIPSGVNNTKDVKNIFTNNLESSFSGGLSNVQNHKACRSFIYNPPRYWKGGDYVKALQLRFNLLPCKSLPSNPTEERRCRAGCHKSESLSHILQQCPLTHWQRIHRHTGNVYIDTKRIKTAAEKRQWSVSIEPNIRGRDGILKKPDIIMRKGNKAIVCDVRIHWEGTSSLEDQFHHKVSIYSTEPFVERIQEIYQDCTIVVLPLIVGARGTWCNLSKALEQELQLDVNETQDIITTSTRGGWQTHQYFMRAVWRTRNQGNVQQRSSKEYLLLNI